MESYIKVRKKVGTDGATVWTALTDRLSSKKAGEAGKLLLTAEELAQETKLSLRRVQAAIIVLAVAGLLTKFTSDGRVAA
jgi:hypothetical protein